LLTRRYNPGTILTTGSEDVKAGANDCNRRQSLVQLRWNPSGRYAPFLVCIECLTTKPIYSSARRFHVGKISGYSSTLPEKLSDDEEVNP